MFHVEHGNTSKCNVPRGTFATTEKADYKMFHVEHGNISKCNVPRGTFTTTEKAGES